VELGKKKGHLPKGLNIVFTNHEERDKLLGELYIIYVHVFTPIAKH